MTTSGVAFFHPICKPLASLTKAFPLSSYLFTLASSPSTPAVVYKDAFLKVPYQGNPQADTAGNFKPIYPDPRTQYQVSLVDVNGNIQYTVNPYLPPCPTTGTGPIQVNQVTGEVSIGPPLAGGSTAALVLGRASGSFAVQLPGNGSAPGQPLIQFLNCLETGTVAVSYAGATNKPGAATPTPAIWLPILGEGGITYYIPLWT